MMLRLITQLSFSLFLLALISTNHVVESSSQAKCERLKTSLTYSQENAPQDISSVLPLIVERVNRELSGVVDVEVLFTGSEIHRRVGKHTVQCLVTRLLSTATDSSEKEGSGKDDAETTVNATVKATADAIVISELDYQEKGMDEHGRAVVTQCFLVPFTIIDVDECNLSIGHSMRHACAEPAMCINTQGSYECLCPSSSDDDDRDLNKEAAKDEIKFWEMIIKGEGQRTPWERSVASSSESTCPGKASTNSCCDTDAHSTEGSTCRSKFKCPVDPCTNSSLNTCVSSAVCEKATTPLDHPTFTCICPDGFMGNGHTCRRGIDIMPPLPKVKFDGVTPTDETIKNGFYCGCTKPIVDPCAGFPKCEGKNEICTISDEEMEPYCACKPGYVLVEGFGCVDESPPTLKLRHDYDNSGITRLKQGDTYKEYAVDVIDENAEDYKRSLKIAYSRPLPYGCETKIGSFQVNYTVAMPWTNPPYARVTRDVIIEDIDECKIDVERYETQCPQIIPHCDVEHGASCKNTNGSYTCICPKYTSGDGFKFMSSIKADDDGKFIDAPVGYNGGRGCVDTSKPVIQVLGPNPKIFRVPKCGGLSGIMKNAKKKKENDKEKNIVGIQRNCYEGDIKQMIIATSGAELCATSTRTNPLPVDCVKATDHTYLGNIDLSSKATVGNPVEVSPLEWKVPYNVMDEAGNSAKTVWRQVVVEEVDLFEMEDRIRKDVLADKDREVEEAVRLALEKHQLKQVNNVDLGIKSKNKNDRVNKSCPTCPACDCSTEGNVVSVSQCNKKCEKMIESMSQTCVNTNNHSHGASLFQIVIDELISMKEGASMYAVALFFIMIVVIYRIFSAVFYSRRGWYYLTADDERKEQEMIQAVTYFSPEPVPRRYDNGYSSANASNGNSPMPTSGNGIHRGSAGPPRVSMSLGGLHNVNGRGGNGVFSPSENRASSSGDGDDIYQGNRAHSPMSPIRPANRGLGGRPGVGSTTPYNLRRRY